MSIKLMGAVFELEVPSTEKLILLAMADHARDDGTGCYPAIGTLARKTSLSVRSVQTNVRRLEEAGFLFATGKSRGGRGLTTEYTLTLGKGMTRMLSFSGPTSNRALGKNPAVTAPFLVTETPQRVTQNPAAKHHKTPQMTTENPAPAAPEPSGTVLRTKDGTGSANGGGSQDAESSARTSTATATVALAFSVLGLGEPYGWPRFQRAVVKRAPERHNGNLRDVLERIAQDCGSNCPRKFFDYTHTLERETQNSEAQREATVGRSSDRQPTTDLFSPDSIRAYLARNAAQLEERAEKISSEKPNLAKDFRDIAAEIRTLDYTSDIEELEAQLRGLEQELFAKHNSRVFKNFDLHRLSLYFLEAVAS